MKSFFVTLTPPPEAREALSQLVVRLAARFSFQGLEDWAVDVKNSRVLGAETEFHDLTRAGKMKPEMRVYFAKRSDAALFARILKSSFSDLRVGNPRALAKRDWMKAWRKHYKTQVIREGKRALAIVPSWKKAPKGPHVRISPGQAFGTGTHPTTRLCLRLLLKHASGARKVLDFGAGTGVLLIAARALGVGHDPRAARALGVGHDPRAARALGVGHDPRAGRFRGVAVESDATALEQCRKNARLNRAAGIRFARKLPKGQFDLVFANVLAPVLLEHKGRLKAAMKPGGLLFLSGILKTEGDAFLKGFRKGLKLVERLDEGDWCAFALTV